MVDRNPDKSQRQYISNPPGHPAATNYTHIVRAGNQLFISGQAGLDENRQLVKPGDIKAQTQQTLENIRRLLEAASADWTDIVCLRIFLTDIRLLPQVREVRSAYFERAGIQPPAITSAGVVGLSVEGALIEIEAQAVLDA